jgi:hypothetical protein
LQELSQKQLDFSIKDRLKKEEEKNGLASLKPKDSF